MILKTLLATVVLVAIVFLALGVKMLFDKNAKFEVHSCSFDEGAADNDGSCLGCELKGKVNCPEV